MPRPSTGSPPLAIRVLGELRIERDGETVALPQSKKARALLGYLIISGGRQRRERLCEIFWDLPDDPRGALRWSLSRLRAVVNDGEREHLRADRSHVWFDAAGVDVDLFVVRDALRDEESRMPTNVLRGAADALRHTLLDGVELHDSHPYQAWLAAARADVHALALRAHGRLAARVGEDPDAVLAELRAFVASDPANADAHGLLVDALVAAGRSREAEEHVARLATMADGERRPWLASLTAKAKSPGGAATPIRDANPAGAGRASASGGASASDCGEGAPRVDDRAAASERDVGGDTVALQQQIRFCRSSDGVRIAYATTGDGPPFVKCANWMNHLEFDWDSPVWRHWIEAFARDRTFIRYDERGNGLSDWDVEDMSLEAYVRDLEAVVDALELDRFPLLGISHGGAVSIAYAIRHPERVSRLVILGSFARGWHHVFPPGSDNPWDAMKTLIRNGWGQNNPAFRQMFTSMFLPGPNATIEHVRWFNELHRITTSPANAERLWDSFADLDVSHLLADVPVPTLILHARDDAVAPFENGRALATEIPGARFVALESANHLLLADEPAWARFVEEVTRFLDED